jgi:hypothetical protein
MSTKVAANDLPPRPTKPPLFAPNFERLMVHTDWRRTWTHIVSGRFSQSSFSGLLFYEQSKGCAEFYETDGLGGISLLKKHQGPPWRDSWTIIVPGSFGGSGFTGLLFYDQMAGYGAVYDTDGSGNLIKLQEYDDWRNSWTHIITVRFPDSVWPGVVFYDRTAGRLEVYASDGWGFLAPLFETDSWPTHWTHVVSGNFSSGAQLFFYVKARTERWIASRGRTYGELFVIDQNGKPTFSSGHEGLPAATHIIPGNYGWYGTSLLFYDQPSGRGTFVDYNDPGGEGPTGFVLEGAESYNNWRSSWDIIVPGDFWVVDEDDVKFQNGFTDLLFYERPSGYGEFYLHEPFNSIEVEPLAGYASLGSVIQGGEISFHVNSRIGPYTIDIYRQDVDEVLMTTITDVRQFPRPHPIGRTAWRDGPDWPAVASLKIPTSWPSGLYFARVAPPTIMGPVRPVRPPIEGETLRAAPSRTTLVRGKWLRVDIPFVVRNLNRASQSKILLCIADTTYQAYNFWGGRSLYGFRSRGYKVWSGGSTWASPNNEQIPRAFRASFRRPHDPLPDQNFPRDQAEQHPQEQWKFWEVPLIRWLARQGIAGELCTSTDLHADSKLLENYRLLVSIGHDEYWSKKMRDQVEAFTAAGGNVAFFSGNVCWWQVRFGTHPREHRIHQMACYKDWRFDPERTRHPDLVTVNWYDHPLNRSEAKMTGVSYLGTPAPYPGWVLGQQFVVQDQNHWILANTGLQNDDFFGTYADDTRTVVGPETDRYQEGSSPDHFEKAAIVFWKGQEAGTMGTFTKGGTVFTAATMNWTLGLSQDGGWNVMDQITLNVFNKLR